MRQPCIQYRRPNLLLLPQVMVPWQRCRPRLDAAGSQNTESFSKHAFLLGRKIDHTIGDDYIHAFVCHRKSFNLAQAKFDIVESIPRRVLARFRQHFRSHVHTDYSPSWSDCTSRQETIESCAGSQIEDSLSCLQRGDSEGISAAESKVGCFGRNGRIVGRVTEGVAAGRRAALVGTG